MKKILFLHGFFATGSCSMAKVLKEAFEDTLAHFPPLFLQHLQPSLLFPWRSYAYREAGGEDMVWYAPLAQKMLMEFSANI